jgi:hypothetical protein
MWSAAAIVAFAAAADAAAVVVVVCCLLLLPWVRCRGCLWGLLACCLFVSLLAAVVAFFGFD